MIRWNEDRYLMYRGNRDRKHDWRLDKWGGDILREYILTDWLLSIGYPVFSEILIVDVLTALRVIPVWKKYGIQTPNAGPR